MANFYKKNFEKKIFTLGAKGENTLKKGPPKWLLWGPLFFVLDTRGLEKNLIFIHPQDEGPRGTIFK